MISAQQGKGIELLQNAPTECLSQSMVQYQLRIPAHQGKLRGALFGLNRIASESYAEDGDWLVDVRMAASDWYRLAKRVDNKLETYVVNKSRNFQF